MLSLFKSFLSHLLFLLFILNILLVDLEKTNAFSLNTKEASLEKSLPVSPISARLTSFRCLILVCPTNKHRCTHDILFCYHFLIKNLLYFGIFIFFMLANSDLPFYTV